MGDAPYKSGDRIVFKDDAKVGTVLSCFNAVGGWRVLANVDGRFVKRDYPATQVEFAPAPQSPPSGDEGEVERIEKIARDLTKALVSLTPGGSEYFVRRFENYYADIEACTRVIRERFESGHRAKIDRVDAERRATTAERERDEARAEVERLKLVLTPSADTKAAYAGEF